MPARAKAAHARPEGPDHRTRRMLDPRTLRPPEPYAGLCHSHSMVAGGLLEMS